MPFSEISHYVAVRWVLLSLLGVFSVPWFGTMAPRLTAIAIRALVNPIFRDSVAVRSTSDSKPCSDCIGLRPRQLPQSVFDVDVRSLCLGESSSGEASPQTDKPEVAVGLGLPDAADEVPMPVSGTAWTTNLGTDRGQPGGSQTRLRNNAQSQTKSPRRPYELSCPEGTPCLPSARI